VAELGHKTLDPNCVHNGVDFELRSTAPPARLELPPGRAMPSLYLRAGCRRRRPGIGSARRSAHTRRSAAGASLAQPMTPWPGRSLGWLVNHVLIRSWSGVGVGVGFGTDGIRLIKQCHLLYSVHVLFPGRQQISSTCEPEPDHTVKPLESALDC